MPGLTIIWILLLAHTAVLRGQARRRRETFHPDQPPDAGVSTLEMVIIALGLIAVATLLVAAITTAVTRRTNQIQ